jgi:ubiquinone/menaquinone biosynthesis C-methylase UbiE
MTTDPSIYWTKKLKNYQQEDWSKEPNLFAQKAVQYFPAGSKILDLGCGNGNDSIFFSKLNYQVTATDFSEAGLEFAISHAAKKQGKAVNFINHDLSKALPFADASFDVVFSSQSLHFFNLDTTQKIFEEIYRVLKSGGILSILLNSLNDPEIKNYRLIETDFFQDPDGIAKRYFSIKSLQPFIQNYQVLLLDENGTSFKDKAKGINNLVEFIGIKK